MLPIENDPSVRRVTELLPNDLGAHQPQSAISGQPPPDAFDIIICDLNIPEMHGVESTRYPALRNYPGSLVLPSGVDIRTPRKGFENDNGIDMSDRFDLFP